MSCTGMFGKKCSCGKYHELPVTMHERPSMLASGWFWLSAVGCAVLYAVAYWALS